MPKGHYLPDSNYFVGVLPNGEVKFYCQEGDFLEEYYEMIKERDGS